MYRENQKINAGAIFTICFITSIIMLPIGGAFYKAINQPYSWRKTICVPSGDPTESYTTALGSSYSRGTAYAFEIVDNVVLNNTKYELRTPPVLVHRDLFPRSQNDVNSWLIRVSCGGKFVCYLGDGSGVTELLSKISPILILTFGTLFGLMALLALLFIWRH